MIFHYIFLQAILWCVGPFFRKQALNTYTSMQFQFQICLGNLILIVVGLYNEKKSEVVFPFFSNKWIVLCISNAFASSYFLNYLSTRLNISDFIPLVKPLDIVLGSLIDYTVFNVHFSLNKLVGILFILIGIMFFNFEFIKYDTKVMDKVPV